MKHHTVAALLSTATARIGGDSARLDAELLLCEALGRTRAWLFAHREAEPDATQRERFEALVQRRESGEPVAYLIGRRGFWTFDLAVTPDTLIPRPETERLVELALERVPRNASAQLADLGTGSGAIALAMAMERPDARVVAVERSPAAARVARSNARVLGVENIDIREGDWYGPLASERFDLIASNPPYIEVGDPHLRLGDVRFEPQSALVAGGAGLDDLRAITRGAPGHLAPGGWLLVEHGREQGAAVRSLFVDAGLVAVETAGDLEGRDRVTLGQRPS